MATTTATNGSSQASPSPFPPSSLLAGFPSARIFQTNNAATPSSPSSTPISSTSTSSNNGVFPPASQPQQMSNMLNPQYYQALMQFQLMQQFMKQHMNGLPNMSMDSNADSRSPSTTTASPSIGQQQKKLPIDPDGSIMCPCQGCEQKIAPDSWASHLNLERANLSKAIESLKENKDAIMNLLNGPNSFSSAAADARKKREFELTRIRSNQQKRLGMKQTLGSSLREQTAQANSKFMISSMCRSGNTENVTPPLRASSGMSLKEGDASDVDRNFCKSCNRHQEFLIIANGLDEARCMDCYRKYRRQVGALPITITESPTEDREGSETKSFLHQRNGSHTTSSASPENVANASLLLTPHEEGIDFGAKSKLDDTDDEVAAKRPRMNFINGDE